MIEKLKKFLKKIGIFQYYMLLKRKLFLERKERKIEELNIIKRKAFYSKFIKENDLCFDVGANIGNRSQTFLDLNARVIAIEPQEDCVEILRRKFGNNIIIEKVGLGKENEELEMFVANESTISTLSKDFIDKTKDNKFKNNTWNKKIVIPITTLDDMIIKYGTPNFCKIDVEGFEPEVLKGLSKPISKISFEYNVPELSNNVIECLEKLHNLSPFYKYNFSIGESMDLKFNEWMDYNDFLQFVTSKEFETTDFGDIYAFIF